MSYLSYDKPDQVKGNNPYQLNRMSVDPRFKSTETGTEISQIAGYSATGEIIYTNHSKTLGFNEPFMSATEPDLMAKYRKPQSSVQAANDPLNQNNLTKKLQQLSELASQLPQNDHLKPKPKPEWMSFYGHK